MGIEWPPLKDYDRRPPRKIVSGILLYLNIYNGVSCRGTVTVVGQEIVILVHALCVEVLSLRNKSGGILLYLVHTDAILCTGVLFYRGDVSSSDHRIALCFSIFPRGRTLLVIQ